MYLPDIIWIQMMLILVIKTDYVERADLHTPGGEHYSSSTGYIETSSAPTVI